MWICQAECTPHSWAARWDFQQLSETVLWPVCLFCHPTAGYPPSHPCLTGKTPWFSRLKMKTPFRDRKTAVGQIKCCSWTLSGQKKIPPKLLRTWKHVVIFLIHNLVACNGNRVNSKAVKVLFRSVPSLRSSYSEEMGSSMRNLPTELHDGCTSTSFSAKRVCQKHLFLEAALEQLLLHLPLSGMKTNLPLQCFTSSFLPSMLGEMWAEDGKCCLRALLSLLFALCCLHSYVSVWRTAPSKHCVSDAVMYSVLPPASGVCWRHPTWGGIVAVIGSVAQKVSC